MEQQLAVYAKDEDSRDLSSRDREKKEVNPLSIDIGPLTLNDEQNAMLRRTAFDLVHGNYLFILN